MILLKIIAVSLVFLIPIGSAVTVKWLGLRKKGWNLADLAFPLFSLSFYQVSDRMYYHSLLPQLVLAVALLAIAICLYFLLKKRTFSYRRFFKFFWRSGFILTFLLYLALVIALLTMKS